MNKIIDIYKEAEKQYSNLLKSYIENDLLSFFPLRNVKFSKPKNRNPREEQIKILDYLEQNSKEKLGYGYSIVWNNTKKTRTYGEVTLPQIIVFKSLNDYLLFLDKTEDFNNFKNISKLIIVSLPMLKQWVFDNPLELTKYKDVWEELIMVCKYFLNEHKFDGNLYVRQLPIEIHTKFIEDHKTILNSILTAILPDNLIKKDFSGVKQNNFEKRYSLNYDKSSIRLRILDKNLYINGLSDIALQPDEFRKLNIKCEKVFITENKMNFLAFPCLKGAIVIFGEANKKLHVIRDAIWIKEKQLFYHGDIDTWGLKILANYRNHFPESKSILMTKEIFEKYLKFAVPEEKSYNNCPNTLTKAEKELFDFLCKQPREKNRLEQERIPQKELLKILKNV